jgi:hypothetical protein
MNRIYFGSLLIRAHISYDLRLFSLTNIEKGHTFSASNLKN